MRASHPSSTSRNSSGANAQPSYDNGGDGDDNRSFGSAALISPANMVVDSMAMRQIFGLDVAVLGATMMDHSIGMGIMSGGDGDRVSGGSANSSSNSLYGQYYKKKKKPNVPRANEPSSSPASVVSQKAEPSSATVTTMNKVPITPQLTGIQEQTLPCSSAAFPAVTLPPRSSFSATPLVPPPLNAQAKAIIFKPIQQRDSPTSPKKVNVNDARARLRALREQYSQISGRKIDAEAAAPTLTMTSTNSDNVSTRFRAAALIMMEEGDDAWSDINDLNDYNIRLSGYLNNEHDDERMQSHLPAEVRIAMMNQNSSKTRRQDLPVNDWHNVRKLLRDKKAKRHRKGLWDKKKEDAELSSKRNMVNLQAGSGIATSEDDYGFDTDMANPDVFADENDQDEEDGGMPLSLFAKQLNKRKRMKINKRKKILNPPRSNAKSRWIYAALAALVAAVIVTITITAVAVGRNSGTNEQSSAVQGVGDSGDDSSTAQTINGSNNTTAAPHGSITIVAPTSPPQMRLPTSSSTSSPGSQHTSPTRLKCFQNREELKAAVESYILDRSELSGVAQTVRDDNEYFIRIFQFYLRPSHLFIPLSPYHQYGFPIGKWCTASVTNFSSVFHSGNLVTSLEAHKDISSIRLSHFDEELNWDVSNGRDFSNLFLGAKHFQGAGLSEWDVSSAVNMESMFHGASKFNQDLSRWNVSRVENFQAMFEEADIFNGDVSTWQTGRAVNMKRMFRAAYAFDGDLSRWNTSSLVGVTEMLARAASFRGGDLRRWDLSKVSSLEGLFFEARAFSGMIDTWNVSGVTTMSQLFQGASNFRSSIRDWDVSNVKDMSFMFAFATSFDSPIGGWDTRRVHYMDSMFYNATMFNQDIGQWDVSNVRAAYIMFMNAASFNQPLADWNLTSVEKVGGLFSGASSFQQDLCKWGSALPGGEDRPSLLRSDSIEAKGTSLFAGTSCPDTSNPVFLVEPAGPFCFPCGS